MGPARAPEVTYEVVDDRVVLVDPAGTELVTLNPVGALVWQALDGERGPTALAVELHDRFTDVTVARLAEDIETFLQELASSGLVTVAVPDARR